MTGRADEPTQLWPNYFVPWSEITEQEVTAYEQQLENAADEAAMQQFLEQNPRFLLQHLSVGRGYWVLPKKRLGAEYQTDFLIAERENAGYIWYAVELERPQARMFTAKGDPSAALTHALRQINDWRNWLSHNRDYATRPREQSGLCLPDIDPELEGLIIMGRDALMNRDNEQRRRRLMRDHRVKLYTFDWLSRQARDRLAILHPHRTFVSEILGGVSNQKSSMDIAKQVFGQSGFSYMDVSATRSLDWDFVIVTFEGEEHEVVLDEVRAYGEKERSIGLSDWEDWLERVHEEIDQRFSLLITERPLDPRLQNSLTHRSAGVWYSVQEPRVYMPSRADVLVYTPRDLGIEEKAARVRIARQVFLDHLAEASQSNESPPRDIR